MKERRIKHKLRHEADKLMPDVLNDVFVELGLDTPTPAKRHQSLLPLSLIGSAAAFSLVGALALPTIINGPVVSVADTYIRVQIVKASLLEPSDPQPAIKYLPTSDETPIFSYKVNRHGKTMALDEEETNAINAENEAAKIIASGYGLRNTVKREATELLKGMVRMARQSGYIESFNKGNVIADRISGDDQGYRARLRQNLAAELETYFRSELIYGIAYEDVDLGEADFSNYQDFSDQEDTYRAQFDMRRGEHDDDDDQRGPDWGDDFDEWLDNHRGGNHDGDDDEENDDEEGGGSKNPNSSPSQKRIRARQS